MRRVIAYVDGFNLYFGLKSKGWHKYYWLDLPALCRALLQPGQQLAAAHYFTTRIRTNGRNTLDAKRQSDYLDALATRPDLTLHYGHFLEKPQRCQSCGATWLSYEEKMTDVNIAVQLLTDAYENRFDMALVISGDSDLTTPTRMLRSVFPTKRIVVAFPPERHSTQLKHAANAYLTIGEANLRQSQLPESLPTATGYVLRRPRHWR